ncbi:MAG TPA: hypothetical protein VJG65_00700, partial [Patescibacteria group bacterium]|nr:hypothetical protein [Patescibacteria group bacterium]
GFDWLNIHQDGDSATLNGRQYSYAMIVADARTRVENCKNLQGTIQAMDQSCQLIDGSVRQSESQIRQALEQVNREKGRVKAKEINLAALRMVEAAEAIARGISIEGADSNEVSNRYNKELDRRIAETKARLEFSNLGTKSSGVVPWEAEQAASQSDLDVIREYANERQWTPADSMPAAPSEPQVQSEPQSPAPAEPQAGV